MSRAIGSVIDEMLRDIPIEERELRATLESVRERSLYTAPEVQGELWRRIADTLGRHFGSPDTLNDWQKRVASTFTGRAI